MSSASKPKHDLRSAWGKACPKCGWAEALTVTITCSALLSIDGTEAHGDHEWEHSSDCCCDKCGHNGVVSDFLVSESEEVSP
jgi:hypothetical protein